MGSIHDCLAKQPCCNLTLCCCCCWGVCPIPTCVGLLGLLSMILVPVTAYFFAGDVIQVLKPNSTATIGDAIFLGNGVVFGILFLIGYIWGYCRKKSAGRWLMYYSLLGMILGYVGFFIVFMVLKNFAIQYEKLGNE